jgi:hypothetical protein
MNTDLFRKEKYCTHTMKGKFLWSNEYRTQYVDSLNIEISKELSMLNDMLGDKNAEKICEVDTLVDSMTNITISAANRSIPFKSYSNKKHSHTIKKTKSKVDG